MRIAFVNSVAGYGSTGKLVELLAGAEDTESRIYYGRKSAALDFKGAKKKAVQDSGHHYFGSGVSFTKHMISTFLLDNHGFSSTAETKQMIEDLKDFEPDIVHLHNLHGYYVNTQLLFDYLRESNVKVIWTFHDCWAFTGHCAHYTSVHCDRWKEGCHDCAAWNHYPPTWSTKRSDYNWHRKKELFTSLDKDRMTIVTPSRWLKEQVEESFLKEWPVVVIPNGIDLSIFHRTETNLRKQYGMESRFIILAVAGQWTREKGSEDLIQMAEQIPDDSVLVVIGAAGRLARKLNHENVIVIERTENASQLAQWYSCADVMVNPTREDTFPTVNIEAQACGCPVVTYNTGGSPEILSAGTGIIVPAENLDRMMEAIEHLRTGETTIKAEDCIRNAAQYSREAMLEQYRCLYDEVMEK